MKSLNGYKVFISIALLLGNGHYNFDKMLLFTAKSMINRLKDKGRDTYPETHQDAPSACLSGRGKLLTKIKWEMMAKYLMS
ncbi:metal-nicotianamine transporter YSL2-like [Silene latifolia]|uniref:metal-nicotianamine transporter YSL2-like n=1 Tax=Silene latifolia TaxID=37657 RepID=UPI003D785935